MNIDALKQSSRIIFEHISGSHAYGTNHPDSDLDIRGIFLPAKDEIISIRPRIQQVSDSTNDTTYYELSRYFELASTCNPNIIESLFVPDDCVKICSPIMKIILEHRHLFISKIAKHKFAGYAHAQIKKAKGQNKYVNNPLSKEHPKREEACSFLSEETDPPMRPISFGTPGFPNLSKLSIARIENSKDMYRLYNRPNARGVFDKEGNILFDNMSLEDEKYYIGVLQYNKESYESTVRQWKNYWEWKNNRNEARWKKYDDSEFECDFKNMSHCVRLILSGKNILLNGEPLVRLTGEDLLLVNNVRSGKIVYDEIMKWVEAEEKLLDEYHNTSTIPHEADINKIDKLYKDIIYSYVL